MDRKLRAFLAIAKAGNLTHAAHNLGVAQPALTKTLQKLEQEVGGQLFERLPRGLVLTSAGEEFLVHARNIEREYRNAYEAVDAVASGYRRNFCAGAGVLYHMTHMPAVFGEMFDEFPNTRFQFEAGVISRLLPMLEVGEIDIALGRMELGLKVDYIRQIPLMEIETGVVMHVDHKLSRKPNATLTPEVLAQYDWVIYQGDIRALDNFNAFFDAHNIQPPNISMQTSSFAMGLQLVAKGEHLMTGAPQLEDVFRQYDLLIKPLEKPISIFQSGIWVRKSSLKYPVTQRFIELLMERIKGCHGSLVT